MGRGDVKLAGAAGPWLDPTGFAAAVAIASAAGLALALARSRRRRRPLRRTAPVPLGAVLTPALWGVWLCGVAL